MQKAFRIITQHRLLSRAELAFSSLVLEEATKSVATVLVREKHGGKFGGATETALRRFTKEINLTTDDPNWRGWWGDEPPFHCPVFVLTHTPRPSIEMAGGTTFHFLAADPVDALQRALNAANGKDIRVGGGPAMVRDYLKAGLVDRLHVAIAPILLGRGIRLWDELRGLEVGYTVRTETAESGTVHLTFQR
jgi:dihydrofolate reductase